MEKEHKKKNVVEEDSKEKNIKHENKHNELQKEIEELLSNGHSSKTWESKCLIGKPPKDKTSDDERIIVDYYDSILEPAVQKRLKK